MEPYSFDRRDGYMGVPTKVDLLILLLPMARYYSSSSISIFYLDLLFFYDICLY